MQDVDAGGGELSGEIQAIHSRIVKLEQVSHDLPRRRNVDEELDLAWREWESTFDAIKDSLILTDSEFKIIQANLAASRFFDSPLDQMVGKTCWQLVHGTDHPPKDCPLEKAKATKKHEEIELYLPQNGIWVTDSVDPVLDQQGSLTGAVHIIRDITQRKRAERLLRKERDRAQKYLDVAGVMMVAIDAEQRVGLINKKGCEILGYKEEEVIAKNWFDNFLPEKNREEVRAVFEKLLRGEVGALEYYENPILTKNGDQRLIAWHNTILRDDKGKVIAALGSGEDITERRRAEEALRESEEKYRVLVENSPNLVAIYQEGALKYVNKIMCEKLGWTFQEMTSPSFDPVEKIIPQRFQSLIRENIAKKLRRENVSPYEVSIKTRDGSEIPVLVQGQGILYHGKPADEIIHIDITERRQAEEALRESEEKYRDLFENAREAIITLDLKGNITGVNKLVEEYGFRREDLIGKSHFVFIPEGYRSKSVKEFENLIRGVPVVGEIEVITPKGNMIVEYRNNPIRRGGQIVGIQEILIDITVRKLAEERVKDDRAQLKALASELTLAEERERRRLAIILHDQISQALVISKIKLEALRKSGRSQKIDKALEDVCNSIGQTIQDTRTLTLDLGNPVLYELGFETAVSEWLTDQIQKKHGLTVEFEDDGEDKPLDDDVRILLFRDVRELLINVVKHAGAHKVKVSLRKLDNICVTVEDDGVGFDPVEVLSMAAKRGEFGLFSIRERLENLGGHLQIDSAPGQGCKITMTAPLKQKEMTR